MESDPSFGAVIFDLDGTLVESAGEIAAALNQVLFALELPPLGQPRVEALIGRGVRVLVERALDELGSAADRDQTVRQFEAEYERVVGRHARLFAGVMAGLESLQNAGIPMAVVTNKPRVFTVELLQRLGIARFFTAVIAGDDGPAKKPEPDMLLAACDKMGSRPAATLMLGDSANDVAAARAAGCPVWCVPYGYNEGRAVETLECDRIVPTIEAAACEIGRGLQP